MKLLYTEVDRWIMNHNISTLCGDSLKFNLACTRLGKGIVNEFAKLRIVKFILIYANKIKFQL